jgi:uncharacterized protein
MPWDASGLEVLTESECFALLASVPVGRVVYSDHALPVIVPVNFTLVGLQVVVRTSRRSRLATQAPGNVVVFEADDIESATRSGWSVVLTGRFHLVDEAAELSRLDALELPTWAPSEHDRYLRLTAQLVTGRRIPPTGVPIAPSIPTDRQADDDVSRREVPAR